MGTVRRLYLYGVAAISLLVLSAGLYNLLLVAISEVADALGAGVIGGDRAIGREQVSLAIALVVVGLPIFAIHWTLVGRTWRGSEGAGLDDRRSTIRAFHFALVATVALGAAVFAATDLLSHSLDAAFGVERFGDAGWLPGDLSLLIVALPVWWYHARRRNVDLRHDRLTGAAAWLPRLYRYGWAFAGVMLVVTASSDTIRTLASVAIGRSDFAAADTWWRAQLAWSISTIVVGAGLVWLHAADARQAIRDARVIGEDDRASAMRAAYFGAVILVALPATALSVASALAGLGGWVLGVAQTTAPLDFLEIVVGPVLVMIPFTVAGWLHWTVMRHEAADRSPTALATAERMARHLAAGVGLALLAVGSGQLLGRMFEVVFGASVVDDLFVREITRFVALVIVGTSLWIPAWLLILDRRTAAPAIERRATVGRAYLYLVVGGALVPAVPSAVFVVYKVIDTVLGGRGLGLVSDIAIPVAVVLVSSVIAAYHGRLTASDLRFAAEYDPAGAIAEAGAVAPVGGPRARAHLGVPATTEVAETTVVPAAVGFATSAGTAGMAGLTGASGSVELVVRGPADAVEAVAEDLRSRLPAGVSMERGPLRADAQPT